MRLGVLPVRSSACSKDWWSVSIIVLVFFTVQLVWIFPRAPTPTTRLLSSSSTSTTTTTTRVLAGNTPFFSTDDHVVEFRNTAEFPYSKESVKDYRNRIRERIAYSQHPQSPARGTIFVSIPSYRDSLCPDTLAQMFSKAADPTRIFVGLVDQMDFSYDKKCMPPKKYERNVRILRVPYEESRGPTLARYYVSKLWDGEEFFFMIDAHTHFIQDWDSVLVNMMRNHPPKSIVTHYPVGEDKLLGRNQYNHLPWLCKAKFGAGAPDGLFMQECEDCRPANRPGNITCPSVFIGAGFTFGSAEMIYDAPYDRYLENLFQGEEVLMAARLWTSGWEFYNPTTNVVSHVYGYRNHSFFSEVKKARSEEPTFQRVRYLLGQYTLSNRNGEQVRVPVPFPSESSEELEDLGMGSVRTIEEYLEFAGIDWGTRIHQSRCKMRYDWEQKKWFSLNP